MLAILISIALASLDTAIANTALPAIATSLHTTPAASVWIINAYQLSAVATILAFASFGGVIGHRKIYLFGLVLFTVSSALCAMSSTLTELTLARVLQGVGASAIMSVNAALIFSLFPPEKLGKGMGLNALVVGMSFAAGPTVASLILSVATWPWLFGVNIPIGLIALAMAIPSLPHTPPNGQRFAWGTAGLSVVTFGSLIYALGEGAQFAGALPICLALLVCVCAGGLMLRREAGHPAPMFPIDLLKRPMFALSALTAVCSFATQGLAFVALPFLLQTAFGKTQVETGFLMTPWPLIVAIMAPIAGRLSDHYPAGVLGGLGLAMLGIGMALLAMLPVSPGVSDIVWRMVICGAGFGFFQAPNMKALMNSAPAGRSGSASGIVATARLTGQTTGAALAAFCFGFAGHDGATLALALGAGFAALGCVMSFLRMVVR